MQKNSCWTNTRYSRKGMSRGEKQVLIKRGPYGGSEGRVLSRTKNGWLRIELYPMGSKMVIKVRNSPLNLDAALYKNKSYAWWISGDSKMLQMEQAENLAAMQSDWPAKVENMVRAAARESDDDRLPLGLRLLGAAEAMEVETTLPLVACPGASAQSKVFTINSAPTAANPTTTSGGTIPRRRRRRMRGQCLRRFSNIAVGKRTKRGNRAKVALITARPWREAKIGGAESQESILRDTRGCVWDSSCRRY